MKREIIAALILIIASTCFAGTITKSNRKYYRQKTDAHGNVTIKTLERSNQIVLYSETNVVTNASHRVSTNIVKKSRIEKL
jgi:hypothetical protein